MNQPILTTRFALALTALLIITLSSCESDAFFTVPNGETKLFAFSEISSEDQILVFVNTAVGINSDDEFYFPDQSGAKVTLYENGMPLENPGFRYIKSKKAFVSQGAFRAQAGTNYGLEVSLKENNKVLSIYGETTIPIRDSLLDFTLTNDLKSFNLQMDLDRSQNEYFLVKTILENSAGEEIFYETSGIDYNGKGVQLLNDNRLLISRENLSGSINLKGESRVELSGSSLKIDVSSITEDAYKYYKSYALQVVSQDLSVSEPVISSTNFENGLGLFAGFSTNSTTISIQ